MGAGALWACAVQRGADWVSGPPNEPESAGRPVSREAISPWGAAGNAPNAALSDSSSPMLRAEPADASELNGGQEPLLIREYGPGGKSIRSNEGNAAASSQGSYRNTYYDFPVEGAGLKDAALYDASCNTIAYVPKDFHDRVCLQGSGKLISGETVSFAKRDCACASECPRSGQKICYERLDSKLFPHGRGATGRAITPLRTVAVDSDIIPLGTVIYVPEFDGIAKPDGAMHDGCFIAEDRGIRVVGRHIDVFAGESSNTAWMNKKVPSNKGVSVIANDPRCMTRLSGL